MSPLRGHTSPLHIAIVGAGIGGLTCAIACRRAKPPLHVTVLERAPEILAVGAGIHIPPNAARILTHLRLREKLFAAGGYEVQDFTLRRFRDGRVIVRKPLKGRVREEYGAEWIAIHRGDYQNVLLQEATRSGAQILTNAEVVDVKSAEDVESGRKVHLKDGRRIDADVVVGADGLWSFVREIVLQRQFTPPETGDLAYRLTFTRKQLQSIGSTEIDNLLKQSDNQVWLGGARHAVFYPLRDHSVYNLVLIVADDMAKGVRTSHGTVEEMLGHFRGWDPVLTQIISCADSAPLKWKLLHFDELQQWTRGSVTLLGDACHPTLPYQGQGAAMAVEDGAVLGLLLDKLQAAGVWEDPKESCRQINGMLRFYEELRKTRTKTNVAGAVSTRNYYHLYDGEEQRKRDAEVEGLPSSGWQGSCSFNWGDADYQRALLGFDVLKDAEDQLEHARAAGSEVMLNARL